MAEAACDAHVGRQHLCNLTHVLLLLENLLVLASGGDDELPVLVGQQKQVLEQLLTCSSILFRTNHVADRFIEHVNMVALQIRNRGRKFTQELLQERLVLALLSANKLKPAPLRDLEEGLASHILHARMQLVHELEQLLDHSLEELPVCLEKPRVLPHHVHDVARNNCLVILATRDLAESKKLLDNSNQEVFLLIFFHGPTDGADSPAEGAQALLVPVGSNLVVQLLNHDLLSVPEVQVSQEHQSLAHGLVQRH
mmetsp:Transcript_9758/g.22379  ORF Transcript_9758/g.22379 Transcript_9758/m.22379 type:complete len:254 (-) Transcript_9758:605-1366(-)